MDKLKSLPATVNIDCHAVVEHHCYSVPYQLIHQVLQGRLSDATVELFQQGNRGAAHARNFQRGKFTTLDEHRLKAHQRHPHGPRMGARWAAKEGHATVVTFQKVVAEASEKVIGESLPSQTVREYFEAWLLSIVRKNSAGTVERYRNTVHLFLKAIDRVADLPLRNLVPGISICF